MAQADVFISYAKSDKLIEDAVCARLEAREIRCWIAPRDVELGPNWAESLLKAIDVTQVMIVILSRKANASPLVFREVERAVNDGDFIVPFRIEDVELSRGMELLISSSHWLDALSPPMENHIQELAASVEALLTSQPAHRPSRSGRRKVVDAAGHLPVEESEEPPPKKPGKPRKRWWTAAAVTAVVGAAAAVFMSVGGNAPQLDKPADKAMIIGPVLKHDWSFDSTGRSNLEFQIRRKTAGGTEFIGRTGATSYAEEPGIIGPMIWQVRATWLDGDRKRKSDWSEPRTVTWYPDTLTKIRETRIVNLAYTEDSVQFKQGQDEPTGFEIEFIRRALGQYLQDPDRGELQIRRATFFAWGEKFYDSLKSPDHDVMVGGISIKENRRHDWDVEFTKPLYRYPQSFVHLPTVEPRQCLARSATAAPCTIGVKGGTTNLELAKEFAKDNEEGLEIRSFTDEEVYDVLANEIAEGRLDLALMDKPYALLLKGQGDTLIVTDVDDSEQKIGIATKKFDIDLRTVLNDAIPTVAPEIREIISNLEHGTDQQGKAAALTAPVTEQ